MSESYYFNLFQEARLALLEQEQAEQSPGELGANGELNSLRWTFQDWINFTVQLYVKYIDILKKVDACYDQTIQPQVRKSMKPILENLLARVIECKIELIFFYNPTSDRMPSPTAIPYVFLDDFLIEYKLELEDLNLPIPRFFKENNSEERRKLRITCEERWKERQEITDPTKSSLPEKDIPRNFFKTDMTVEDAIRLIQIFETSRQNLHRINVPLKTVKQKKKAEAEANSGEKKLYPEEELRRALIEKMISIKKINKLRNEELEFLKMVPEAKPEKKKAIEEAADINNNRKVVQEEKEKQYNEYKDTLTKNIKLVEGYQKKEGYKNERREWISNYKALNKEAPYTIGLYYQKNDKKDENEKELDDAQMKVKENQAKDKLKKGQDAKKKDENGPLLSVPQFAGPTESVRRMLDGIEDFKRIYETPSDFMKEDFFENIAKEEIIPGIENAIKEEVDALMEMEIRNLRFIQYKGKKDPMIKKMEKERKKAEKAKAKANKEKLGFGEKLVAKIEPSELLSDLLVNGIIRKMVPHDIEDLICDFNYIGNTMQLINEKHIDVPLFYSKQLIKEFCIYPLGSKVARAAFKFPKNSFLFFGPSGCGKTHAAIAIAQHADALFIDLSASNTEKYTTKEDITKLYATAWRVAKQNQPAVIYFDNVETIIPGKVKGQKPPPKDPMAKLKKKLLNSHKGLIQPDQRIIFIGCSNKGHFINPKDMKTMFDTNIYFTNPSFSDRYKIWKTYLTKKIGREYDIEYDVLAQMSQGFAPESIISTIDHVLTKQRLDKLNFYTLEVQEFISSLSKTSYLYKQDFDFNRDFLFKASGAEEIHKFLDSLKNDTGKKK